MFCKKLQRTGGIKLKRSVWNKHWLKILAVCAVLSIQTVMATIAHAQEITAVNFNGDLIGKVIPDGKVVS